MANSNVVRLFGLKEHEIKAVMDLHDREDVLYTSYHDGMNGISEHIVLVNDRGFEFTFLLDRSLYKVLEPNGTSILEATQFQLAKQKHTQLCNSGHANSCHRLGGITASSDVQEAKSFYTKGCNQIGRAHV